MPHSDFPALLSCFLYTNHLITRQDFLLLRSSWCSTEDPTTPLPRSGLSEPDKNQGDDGWQEIYVLDASERCYDLIRLSLTYVLTNRRKGSCCWVVGHKGSGPKDIQAKETWVGNNVERTDVQIAEWSWERGDKSVANLRYFSLACLFDCAILPEISLWASK